MNDARKKYDTKRCPECRTHLPADAKKCSSCGQKVGEALPTGIAKKPVDWVSYVSFIVALVALGCFLWYAFLK